MCEALPRMLSFINNKWNRVKYFLIANAIFYLSYDIFAFACIDKGPYCQESYLILLINRRHIATYVYLICILFNIQMELHIICIASS